MWGLQRGREGDLVLFEDPASSWEKRKTIASAREKAKKSSPPLPFSARVLFFLP